MSTLTQTPRALAVPRPDARPAVPLAPPALALVGVRAGGAFLIAAAALFFLAWLLMPGVGVTDAQRIFELVSGNARQVQVSVILQLLSAACYAPACVALALRAGAERQRGLVLGAVMLLLGAMGSTADSMFHWLAAEMTAPGIARDAMLPVMARMQGPALVALAPMITAFFFATGLLAFDAGRVRWVGRGCYRLALLSPLPLLLALVRGHGREAGLGFLAAVATVQVWLGLGLWRRDD